MLTRRLSLIELSMVMLIVGVVAYAVFSRTLRYFEFAEKAAMTVTILEVDRGMRVRLALAAMRGASASPEQLENINPFEFARALPPNYLGELGGHIDMEGLKRGNWFYDPGEHEIAYLPRLSSRLRTVDGEEVRVLRFRVKKGGPSRGLPHLAAVSEYTWDPEFGTF